MSTFKLAEGLLRRKELQEKVNGLKSIKEAQVYEVIAKRVSVSEGLDDITAKVPKLDYSQVMAEFNFAAKQLRLIDGLIQQANWTTEIDGEAAGTDLFADYVAPEN